MQGHERSKLYPLILGEVGRGVVFGANISLRHPHKIRIADGVIVDENVLLEAKGDATTGSPSAVTPSSGAT